MQNRVDQIRVSALTQARAFAAQQFASTGVSAQQDNKGIAAYYEKLNALVAESYAAVDRSGAIILYNANIPEYLQANRFNHEPKRPRKLLLHAKEIVKLAKGVEREGMTIVPLRIYFNAKGRAKIAIALGRGKKLHDKRETEKVRDWNRDKTRLMRERG